LLTRMCTVPSRSATVATLRRQSSGSETSTRRAEDLRVSVLVLERADPLLVNVERHDAQILFDEDVDKGFSDSAGSPP
jgi:hypothetical protein